jgi:predicted ATPase
MLTRVYIDNFSCFVNFEYRPGRRQLILGQNGTGKSTLLYALLLVRQFVVRGDKADDVFALGRRTRWLSQPQQTWEIEATLDGGSYAYRLVVEPWGDPARPRVVLETVSFGGRPIFEFDAGEVRLYNDRFEHKVTYPFDWHRSALATIVPRKDNTTLTRFKIWLSNLLCFRIDPFQMGPRAEGEDLYPHVNLSNIASWYRHLLQAHPKDNAGFLESLRAAFDDFSFLGLEPAGENVRLLFAEFAQGGGTSVKLWFHELSDGQRCLICLYAILHFVLAKGSTVILDEPDNFVSLREIQPWLMTVADLVEQGHGQILLISHHPELINQWAPDCGVRFAREGVGPVRIDDFRGDPDSLLSPAELVARGWDSA